MREFNTFKKITAGSQESRKQVKKDKQELAKKEVENKQAEELALKKQEKGEFWRKANKEKTSINKIKAEAEKAAQLKKEEKVAAEKAGQLVLLQKILDDAEKAKKKVVTNNPEDLFNQMESKLADNAVGKTDSDDELSIIDCIQEIKEIGQALAEEQEEEVELFLKLIASAENADVLKSRKKQAESLGYLSQPSVANKINQALTEKEHSFSNTVITSSWSHSSKINYARFMAAPRIKSEVPQVSDFEPVRQCGISKFGSK